MGRPKKPINWDHVEFMMAAGCTVIEICGFYLIHASNFYLRFEKQFGNKFQEYRDEFYQKGNANLRSLQYKLALSGNLKMIELLGKERLGQGQEKISIKMEITHVDPTSDSPV